MSHRNAKNVGRDVHKMRSADEINENKIIEDLGVIVRRDVSFSEHIDDLILLIKIKAGLLFRTFKTREAEPMLKMFNSFIRSKLDYCSIIWNPDKKEEIVKIERIQKNFTSKIRNRRKNYHERLKILKLYNLERRWKRILIISAWQQIEGKKRKCAEA